MENWHTKKINIPVPDECVEELYNLWDDMNRNCTMINQYKFWKYVATFCPESTREDCRCDINTDKILKPYITVRETTL